MNEIKKLNKLVKQLKEDHNYMKDQLKEMTDDRNLYRDYCVGNFKWFVKLIGESRTPCLKYLIKEHGRLFNKTERFYMELGE